jgi:hypothetical protein
MDLTVTHDNATVTPVSILVTAISSLQLAYGECNSTTRQNCVELIQSAAEYTPTSSARRTSSGDAQTVVRVNANSNASASQAASDTSSQGTGTVLEVTSASQSESQEPQTNQEGSTSADSGCDWRKCWTWVAVGSFVGAAAVILAVAFVVLKRQRNLKKPSTMDKASKLESEEVEMAGVQANPAIPGKEVEEDNAGAV